MKKILLLAAIVYLFIAPLTYHPDNKEVLFWASQKNGTVWNIWEYGEKNLPPDKQYGYPPFHFVLDKLQYTIAKPLAGDGFNEWIGTPHKTDLFQPNLARYMMAAKFTLILFSLLAGYFIYLLAKRGLDETRARIAMAIWFFNPISIYSIPIMGQNDVLAITFFLGGWLLLEKKPWLATAIFGLAASIKTYPLIWLFFLLFSTRSMNISKRLGIFIVSGLVFALTLVPFLHNPTFISVGMKPEVNARFLIPRIDIGFDQSIYIIPLLLGLVLVAGSGSAPAVLLTVNLLLLGFSHFHPQWYTWVIPFFALWITAQKKRDSIGLALLLSVVTLMSWVGVVILFADKWLSVGLFGVTNPAIGNLPVIREFLVSRGVNVTMFDSLFHTALAFVGIATLVSLLRRAVDKSGDFNLNLEWLKKITIKKKPIKLLVGVFVLVAVFVVWIAATRSLPTPSTEGSPYGGNFTKVDSKVIGTITTHKKDFYRYDLTFQNPDRANAGLFEAELRNGDQVLHKQIVSGLNMGEESTIRFDLSRMQTDSAEHSYQISLQAIEGTKSAAKTSQEPQYIYVKTTKANSFSSMTATTFYLPSEGKAIIKEVFNQLIFIVTQIPWYYAGMTILLLLFALG